MRFYTTKHKHYCGIDLHAKTMYVCIMSQEGKVLLHRNLKTDPEVFLRTIAPFREDLVVGVECMFTWYWLADLCDQEKIHFVLGHALYMKAIHGGKAKNDRIDAYKIATILRGGDVSLLLCLPCRMAFDSRPAAKTASNGSSTWPADVPCPKHPSPVQSTDAKKENRLSSQPTRGGGAIHRCQRIQERRDRPRAHGPLR